MAWSTTLRFVGERYAVKIAELHLKHAGDRLRMGRELGIDRAIDLSEMAHPSVVRECSRLASQMRRNSEYNLEDHRRNLEKIRDRALEGEDFKAALAAEIAIGKVSGFYEPRNPDDQNKNPTDITNLSSAQLKQLLAQKLVPSVIDGEVLDE